MTIPLSLLAHLGCSSWVKKSSIVPSQVTWSHLDLFAQEDRFVIQSHPLEVDEGLSRITLERSLGTGEVEHWVAERKTPTGTWKIQSPQGDRSYEDMVQWAKRNIESIGSDPVLQSISVSKPRFRQP